MSKLEGEMSDSLGETNASPRLIFELEKGKDYDCVYVNLIYLPIWPATTNINPNNRKHPLLPFPHIHSNDKQIS